MKTIIPYEVAKSASVEYFNGDEMAADVFLGKYALRDLDGNLLESTPDDMHRRLARELARIESKYENSLSEEDIYQTLKDFSYIVPQGSPMSGIGNEYNLQTLGNCYTLPSPLDSYGSILKTDEELVQIAKRRGGIGFDISNIRPKGLLTANSARTTDGIGVFMERFSNSCREVAQCVAEGELVLTEQGLKRIEEVQAGKDRVWTQKGWVKILNVKANGTKHVQRVTSSFGYEVKTTEEHVYLTTNDFNTEERRLKDFEVGDEIILIPGSLTDSKMVDLVDHTYQTQLGGRNPQDVNLPTQLDSNLAWILGYMHGNGYVECDKFGEPRLISSSVPSSRLNIIEKYTQKSKDLFGYDINPSNGDGACKKLTIHSKVLCNWLSVNNILKDKDENIRVPDKIWQSPANVQAAFISGFFDADGYASGRKKGYSFGSVAGDFLKDIQLLLMSMGIPSKISVEGNRGGMWKDLYNLSVTGNTSQRKLLKILTESVKVQESGFIAKRENYLTPFNAAAKSVKYNKIPSCPNNSQRMSLVAFEDSRLDEQPLIVDTIQSIEDVGEMPTYDLVLEEEHLFFCNGFYVHNSGRRGALMLTIDIRHPEVETFINIKKDLSKVTGANISVRLNDEFLKAVETDSEYDLVWPINSENPKIRKTVKAKNLWEQIIEGAWSSAEPGLLMWSNVERRTPSEAYEQFKAVSCNPCSEIVLEGYGVCRLTCINLLTLVKNPFMGDAFFDQEKFNEIVRKATRIMDDIVDLDIEATQKIIDKIQADSEPDDIKSTELNLWKNIQKQSRDGRRIGLGITALGDTIASLNVRYGSEESVKITEDIYRALKMSSWRESIILAKERGSFPACDPNLAEKNEFIAEIINDLNEEERKDFYKYGYRHVALTTTAPTGSVSILTKTTSGIEPVFMPVYVRRKKMSHDDITQGITPDFVDHLGDKWINYKVYHHGVKRWMDITGRDDIENSPYGGASSGEIDWKMGVKLQAAAQRHVCHAISRTQNLPSDISKETVGEIYLEAARQGCKGFTVYRDGCRTGVLVSSEEKKEEFKSHHAPKRPEELTCDVHHVTYKGAKWVMLVGLMNDRPYELFGGAAVNVQLPKKYKQGKIVRHPRKVAARYDLHLGEGDEEIIVRDIAHSFDDADQSAWTRLVSTALRHGTPVKFIVEQLQKERDTSMFTFAKVMARTLKTYIKDGEKMKGVCQNCGSEDLIYQEGCLRCQSCGSSRC